MNFSAKPLTDTCISALSKGLSFVPTTSANDFDTIIDFQKFFRTLRLKAFFHSSDTQAPVSGHISSIVQPNTPTINVSLEGKTVTSFRKKSTFIPQKNRNASLDTYCRLVEKDVRFVLKNKKEYKMYNNLSKAEREAISTLGNDTTIVVRPADKGGATVVQNRSDYDCEIMRQLNDVTFYRKLSSDPTNQFKSDVHDRLQFWFDNDELSRN